MLVNKRIPDYIKHFFWDVKKDEVDLHRHYLYIIRRILNFGDSRAVNWLRNVYSETLIKEVVKNKRGLEKKTFVYWTTYFEQTKQNV